MSKALQKADVLLQSLNSQMKVCLMSPNVEVSVEYQIGDDYTKEQKEVTCFSVIRAPI